MGRAALEPFVLMLGGTSLTAGRLCTPPYPWTMRLLADMRADPACKGEVIIINTGKGSETSNFGAAQAAKFAALKPTHVLMEDFGINDCAIGPVSLAQATINFDAMVASYRAANPDVIICHQTMSPASAGDLSRANLADYYDNGTANAVLNDIETFDNYNGTALVPGGWPKPLPPELTVGAVAQDVPAGFSVIGPSEAWNPADKGADITLTNADLTATRGAAGGWQTVRGLVSKAAGKWYFEVTLVEDSASSAIVGICTAALSLTTFTGNAAASVGFQSNGVVHVNAVSGVHTNPILPEGATAAVAFDLTNNRIWYRQLGGNWNNSPTADPATNTGGIAITAGTYFPAVSLTADLQQWTAKFNDDGDALHPIWDAAFELYSYPNILAWAVEKMEEYWPD